MDQRTLADAVSDAALLGHVLTSNEQTARLRIVAGNIAHAWAKAGVPLSDALECARNVVQLMAATGAEVGVTHATHDAIEYRRSLPDLYPAWQSVSRIKAMRLSVIALGVWCGKGWRL